MYANRVSKAAPAYGLVTSAFDLVGRHSWRLVGVVGTDGRVEGSLGYDYDGLGNPVLSLDADQDWDASGPLFGTRADGQRDTLFLRERAELWIQLAATAATAIVVLRVIAP